MDPSVALGAGGSVSPLVADLGLCLVAVAVLSIAFVKLRIPVIAALLGAGVALGPAGLEAVQDRASIQIISNLGLTLLLFVIGLEVDVQGLLARGRTLIVGGVLQVPLTLAAGMGGFLLLGVAWSAASGVYTALYLGVACAFSSTLLVVKYLHDLRQTDSTAGRLAVGLLVFQDLWAIVFLALQPSFAHPSVAPIVLTFVGTVILGALAAVVARFALRHGFHVVARSPELVVTLALGWCFGVALFGVNLGPIAHRAGIDAEISVSMEMGALIAGATIATSPFAYEVGSRVIHLRDFFVTLFFVGLGMSIPIPDGAAVIALAAIVAAIAVALRLVLFVPLLYATGLDRRTSVNTSVKLAQVSEFCLVIAYLGQGLGHVDGATVSVVIFAFVLTALATPALFAASDVVYRRLRRPLDRLGIRSRGTVAEDDPETPIRLALLGFHRVGAALLAELERADPGLVADTLVIDINTASHDELRRRGVRVVYGDVGSSEVLRHAGLARARVVVSTVPDELLRGATNATIVRQVRALAPEAIIIAHCTKVSQATPLLAAGADHVFRGPTEIAAAVLPAILAALGGELPSYLDSRHARHGTLAGRNEVLD